MSDEAEQREHSASAPRPWPARLLDLSRRAKVTALTAVVALAAALVGLVFTLWPGLRPDPQVQLNATLKPLGMETKVRYADFLRRTGGDPSGAAHIYGDLVYVQVETEGLKGYESRLRWYLYNAGAKARLPEEQQPDGNVRVVSGTTSDRYVIPVWVQPPAEKGTYFLQFELKARGVLLDIAKSPTFPYCRVAGCGNKRASQS